MSQLPLDFPLSTSHHASDYKASNANTEALHYIEQWPHWPHHALLLYGPPQSGKTHLSQLFEEKSNARRIYEHDIARHDTHHLLATHRSFVLERIDTLHDEAALLHFYNRVIEAQGYALFTSENPPTQWTLRLPDLKSRLCALPSFALHIPDEALLEILLTKGFSDRQLKISKETIEYLVPRIERSFEAVQRTITALDQAALAEQKPVTIPFVKKILGL